MTANINSIGKQIKRFGIKYPRFHFRSVSGQQPVHPHEGFSSDGTADLDSFVPLNMLLPAPGMDCNLEAEFLSTDLLLTLVFPNTKRSAFTRLSPNSVYQEYNACFHVVLG